MSLSDSQFAIPDPHDQGGMGIRPVPPQPNSSPLPPIPDVTSPTPSNSTSWTAPPIVESEVPVIASAPTEEREDRAGGFALEDLIAQSPPWLTSFVTHMIGFVILALILVPMRNDSQLEISAVFSDRLGEQTEELVMSLEPITVAPEETMDASDVELPPVENPLFAPPKLALQPDSETRVDVVDVAEIGLALSGREAGRKEALLKAFGGNAETEKAVQMALQWLARFQRRQGHWSLKGPYTKGSVIENREAATGLALLAFHGAGHTDTAGLYQDEVARAWQFLLRRQNTNGSFYRSGDFNHRFYTHSICTLALCEVYAMTRDEKWKEPAQLAIDYLVLMQSDLGGWRYDPAVDADTSVTGWVLLALQSGQSAGLHVPSKTFDQIAKYLDLASSYDGARYGYKPGHAESLSMTAEALLCRQYLGWQRKDPRLLEGVEYLRDHPVQMRDPNIYYWYYATQVMHHMEGDVWEEWNEQMKFELPRKQIQNGKEKGSWYFPNDRWGRTGGRLFTTCLNCYMLEVYYRHLPIYSPVFRFQQPQQPAEPVE